MIELKTGSIFNAPVRALVNPVNCEGVMGKGLALQFKRRYPEAYFLDYARACRANDLVPGVVRPFHVGDGRWVVSFPTKNRWRSPSKIEYVEAGLHELTLWVRMNAIESIAVPALGCGLGGLSWSTVVRPLIEKAFADLDGLVDVWLYPPEKSA